jgi:hypothetical protein
MKLGSIFRRGFSMSNQHRAEGKRTRKYRKWKIRKETATPCRGAMQEPCGWAAQP